MPLQPGTTLGSYQVTAKIGEGGMGEVYRARDTKLDRDVALKVLPEAFTSDPDRLARFERVPRRHAGRGRCDGPRARHLGVDHATKAAKMRTKKTTATHHLGGLTEARVPVP